MTSYVALLRAVNVGGTVLPMADLRRVCQECGFSDVSTYIQSGNAVFRSRAAEGSVKRKLETALTAHLGKPVAVLIRTAAELRAAADANPFPDAAPNQLIVLFLDAPPARGILDKVVVPGREQWKLRGRDLYVHYPDGMGKSKLKLPVQSLGTARNLNTVRKLVEMAQAISLG